jgi:hypothetical protein
MHGRRFKLNIPVLALERPGGVTQGVYISAGEIVTADSEPLNDEILIDVEWNGRKLMMFSQDLVQHAERLDDAPSDE